MHKLTFKAADVAVLVAHARKSAKHRSYYADMGITQIGACLNLVGDDGVYLMSSGIPHLPKKGGPSEHHHVVYAEGIDPRKDEFDVWWARKSDLETRGDFSMRIPIDVFDKLPAKPKGTITVAWLEGQDCMIFGPERFTVELPGGRPKALHAIA